jgi:hypothetical protein
MTQDLEQTHHRKLLGVAPRLAALGDHPRTSETEEARFGCAGAQFADQSRAELVARLLAGN